MEDQPTPTQQPQNTETQVAPSASQASASQDPVTPPDSTEKFFATIGYFAFLFVLPIVAKPKSKFCQFHAKQSIVLFVLSIVVLIFLAAIPAIGSLLTLAIFALYVLAIYRAYKGELWNIPVVSVFARMLNFGLLYSASGMAISSVSGMKEKAEDLAKQVSEKAKEVGKQE